MLPDHRIWSFAAVVLALIAATSSGCRTSDADSRHETAETLIQGAATKLAAGDFRKNADLLKQAAETEPGNARVWWKLCEAYQLTEELDLALNACKQELKLSPSSTSHNGLGLVYLARKEYADAADEFEKAAMNSKVSQIQSNFVWALLESKQYQRAVPAAQHLVELSRSDPPELKTTQGAYHYLAIAYLQTGQADKAQQALTNGYRSGCSLELGDKPEDALVRCDDGSSAKKVAGPTSQ